MSIRNFLKNSSALSRKQYNVETAQLNLFSEEKLRKDFRSSSEKRVKEMLILDEIAKQNEIKISEEELTEGFKELASTSGQNVEIIRKYYEVKNLVGSLREKVLEEKTLNYLAEHANISGVKQ